MFDIAYVVMHDCSKEYWNDALGFVIGVFGDDGAAKLALMQAGFTELDSRGNYWKGSDRAWILELRVDKLFPESIQSES